MESKDKVGTLVVDSGALIKGVSIQELSHIVVTVKEILSEVRDVNTRRRLQVLPFEISFREPSHQALHHVTSFAKKTGDYPSLSSVDLRLLALTYQLECELGPQRGANLRSEPCTIQTATSNSKAPPPVGFYSGSKKPSESPDTSDVSHGQECTSHDLPQDKITCIPVEDLNGLSLAENSDLGRNGDNTRDDNLEQNEDNVELNESSDDEDSWITPTNYQEACEKMGGALEAGLDGITVGCITTDYAMQNVLLQMGLNVISVDGMRVKQLRTYAMKCKACHKVCGNTGLLFCPHCGNRTLFKVAAVLNGEEGTVQYRSLSEKQFSHKGLRYSLPLPKGGRHANNPILAPDQRETSKERRSRGGRMDPLHPDYIAQTSPFAMKDVTSRGAQIKFAQGRGSGKNGWRNNPNSSKPKGRRK